MSDPFASETETYIYAKRIPLIPEESILNPISTVYSPDVITTDYMEPLTNEAIPKSVAGATRRITTSIKSTEDTLDLPIIRTKRNSGDITEEGLPFFWLRRENIDIDSTWWNLFDDLGLKNNTKRTDFNGEYWRRSYNDPDIDWNPEEDYIVPQQRDVLRDLLLANFSPADIVPYEVVYPEWFKLHPQYVETSKHIDLLGLDIQRDILNGLRESKDQRKVDGVFLSYFTSLLPTTDISQKYSFKFFKHLFKDRAFANPVLKQTSPCVTYALEAAGFYNGTGNNIPFSHNPTTGLGDLKAANYYYEYKASEDSDIRLGEIFEFEDVMGEARIELQVSDIIIRKVTGTIASGKAYETVVGKGEIFPEFTNFGEAVYPANPLVASFTHSNADLQAYNDNVTSLHNSAMTNNTAYISFKFQKSWGGVRNGYSTSNSSNHAWDLETYTDLVAGTTIPYYEEIIIVNPRLEYRSIYSENFKTPRLTDIAHPGDFWVTSDNPNLFAFNSASSKYVTTIKGERFDGVDGDTVGLALPISNEVLKTIVLKDRETLLQSSLSVFTISVQRVSVSFTDKYFAEILTAIYIIVLIATGRFDQILKAEGFYLKLKAAASILIDIYLESLVVGFVSEQFIKILVDTFGLKDAQNIAAGILAISSLYGYKNPEFFSTRVFAITANFDSELATISQQEYAEGLEKIEEQRKETIRTIQEIKEQSYEFPLSDVDPNLSLQTRVFLLENESPEAFYLRTIGNLNPGIGIYTALENQIEKFKFITHTETPVIATDEELLDEYVDKLA